MRLKTISYRRKKDIPSRKLKEKRKNREEHTVKAMPVTEAYNMPMLTYVMEIEKRTDAKWERKI
jgi:hypothetical protein